MRAFLAVCGVLTWAGGLVAQQVDFTRDVLPVLSDRCFQCHGPDAGARKAGLRLDEREGAIASRREGDPAVTPGDPMRSALYARVVAASAEKRMPPPESRLSLTAAEIDVLRRWIEQGAPWAPHWAFVPPVEPPIPAPPGDAHAAAWPRSDLDRLVLADLMARGLRPSPPATPGELLRRVSLDLTGLPPLPAAIDAFERDSSDAAYERIVDGLLASPHYGERMAWPWLEAARYADTDGYQSDPTREMWPWRDWLVRALDANVPFDRLTIEMLAGDLLPDATPEQRLASAFHRNHAYNGEGGRIAEETRVENVFDRTETTAAVWLGMTFECARCHDHKFDPVTQRDYYALFAFFDQTSETGAIDSPGRRPPTMRYVDADLAQRIAAAEQRVAAARAARDAPDASLDGAQRDWEATASAAIAADPARSTPATAGAWRELGPRPRAGDPPTLGDSESWRPAPELVEGKPYMFAPVTGATYLRRTVRVPSARRIELSLGSDDGIRVFWNGALVLVHDDVQRGVAPDQERVALAAEPGDNDLLLEITNTGGPGGVWFRTVGEFVDGIAVDVARILAAPREQRTGRDRDRLRDHFRAAQVPDWERWTTAIAEAEREHDRLVAGAPEVMVMDELPPERRRTVHVLERGGYDKPREEVVAATPSFLPQLPEGAPRDRLALARWLVSAGHPLTARVAVNRCWQLFFGRGIVETVEDFGRQGARPTHAALLDWLACRYVASGWDTKALHRAIVTSATYRQSAHGDREVFADDPDAALLQRAPRHRLPSWMLRDQALALGGLLIARRGGPPVRPYQPAGVWAEATFDTIRYEQDHGEDLHRRSLYTFWRRIVGPTTLFDTPSRQSCVVRTKATNSPLHALVLRNDPTFVEAARGFAARAWREGGAEARTRIAWAFRAATARTPGASELDRLVARWEATRARFVADPAAAAALLAVGEAPCDTSIPPAELAAATVVASILLNLDEVLTRS
ncbi:MAG: PSD1 and planctomycete cytochrome C domain-containing protein [Planctomycetota bacterium]